MSPVDMRAAIVRSLDKLTTHQDELRDLDQKLGDGDLGITVSAGAKAVIAALADVADDASAADVVKVCARAFANANPSTMAALVAGGLLAGSRVWADATDIDTHAAGAFAAAAASSISTRGKSEVGDKTILDALVPAADALQTAPPERALDAAIDAAQAAVEATRDMQSKRGRASWLQERSIGTVDPGATAFLRFLESWRDAIPE